MIAIPDLILLTLAVGLGIYLGIQYLRRARPRPVLVGAHLLSGAAAMEGMVIVFHGTPSGAALKPGLLGFVAAGLIALAMFSGLIAGLIARRSRRTADISLASHVAIAALGVVLFLVWLTKATAT